MEGSIKKRGDTYTVIIALGKDPATGKKKYKWYGGYKSKKEAEKARTELLYKLERGEITFENDKLLLKDYLEKWINIHKNSIRPSTYISYRGLIDNHVVPNIGFAKVKDLKPLTIQDLYKTLIDGVPNEKEALSPKTVRNVHVMLHKAFEQAKEWQVTYNNIMEFVTPPKIVKSEINVLTKEQMDILLNHIQNEHYYIAFLLAVTTGMRRGEILGLEWSDIDFKDKYISLKRARIRTGTGELKTDKSKRVIALDDYTLSELQKEKSKQDNRLKEMSKGLVLENDFVCKWDDGRPFDIDYLTQKLPKILKELGLPQVRFHDLRHSNATYLLSKGVHPKIVQERLGHSTITTTMDIYSHVSLEMQKDAIRKLS